MTGQLKYRNTLSFGKKQQKIANSEGDPKPSSSLYIFKKMKNACNLRLIIFVSVDKKMTSPHNEWYIGNVLVSALLSSKLAHGTYCLRSFTQLFRLLGIVFNAQPVLLWL